MKRRTDDRVNEAIKMSSVTAVKHLGNDLRCGCEENRTRDGHFDS